MNRQERRKLKKQGIQVPKDPSINIKLSDLGRDIMTPTMEQAMMHEINQQCLEADKRFSLDLDTMVIWTLYQCYGWREKRLHDFYLAMAKEHRRNAVNFMKWMTFTPSATNSRKRALILKNGKRRC